MHNNNNNKNVKCIQNMKNSQNMVNIYKLQHHHPFVVVKILRWQIQMITIWMEHIWWRLPFNQIKCLDKHCN